MPDLRCTVQTCTHNQNYYCNLDSIVVGGNSAKKAAETSCDSFEERKGGSAYADAYSDMEGKEASAKSSVDCKATDCMYNKECQCHAGKISVEEMPAIATRQSVQHSSVDVHKIRQMPDTGFNG